MAGQITSACNFTFIVLLLLFNVSSSLNNTADFFKDRKVGKRIIPKSDVDLLEFPLNLEYLEAEFFLWGSTGHGLDKAAPDLTMGGPSPVGGRKASLDSLTNEIIYQFALQEIGHLRAIKKTVKGFPRPLMNLSSLHFATVMNSAFGHPLHPPFNPYANSLNYLLASYMIPYVGLSGYVGASPKLRSAEAKRLVAGLLAVESGQDAVIRAMLYERRLQKVMPYGITVQEFTSWIKKLRNKLGNAGSKDEGLYIDIVYGAERKTHGNVLVGDEYSLGYPRTPKEILRIVYASGDEKVFGGFYPKGADGHIAKSCAHG